MLHITSESLVQVALHFLQSMGSTEPFEKSVSLTGWFHRGSAVWLCSTDRPGRVIDQLNLLGRPGRSVLHNYSVFKLLTGSIIAARSDCQPTVRKAMEIAMMAVAMNIHALMLIR